MQKYIFGLCVFLIYIQLPVTIRLVILVAVIMLGIYIISVIVKSFDPKNEVKNKPEQLLQDQPLTDEEEKELLALSNRVVDRLRKIRVKKDKLHIDLSKGETKL